MGVRGILEDAAKFEEGCVTKTLVINSFNRPILLRDCLESCLSLENLEEYKIVMVHQKGNFEVERIVNEHAHLFSTLITTNPSGDKTDEFITNNRILGLYVGFEFWKSEFVVSIEDDVILARDALKFIEYAFETYRKNPSFRGVNLGSKLSLLEVDPISYSCLRFGMHGPASMITKKTWKKINPQRVMKNSSVIFDAQIEFALKTGFMVTPNASRYLDQGFEGSHTGTGTDKGYFQGLQSSFVGHLVSSNSYFHKDILPNWRKDCIIYKTKDDWGYFLKSKLYWTLLKFSNVLKLLNRKVS